VKMNSNQFSDLYCMIEFMRQYRNLFRVKKLQNKILVYRPDFTILQKQDLTKENKSDFYHQLW